MTQKEAISRCEANGLNAVSFDRTNFDYSNAFWNHAPCQMQVQVNPDGLVARVDVLGNNKGMNHVRMDNRNYFHVHWAGGAFPKVEDGCHAEANGTSACTLHVGDHGGASCLCDINVEHYAPFSSEDRPSREKITENLMIGYRDPSGDPELTAINYGNSVVAYSGSLGNDTYVAAYKVVDSLGRTQFLKNTLSNVRLTSSALSFRNPPTYTNVIEPTARDASDDVDSLIDHLFYHPNTAPFIAHKLIQRFTTSNPSPRYIKGVAGAFTLGSYGDFGSGSYGDLGATFAAIFLDSEASSSVLDSDPSFGTMREPLLKILHILRSLSYSPVDFPEVELRSMADKIGQMAYESPTVFNYYDPTFVPHQLASRDIKAPEGQLLNAPFTISWLNGAMSLIRYGLTRCSGGFAFSGRNNCQDVDKNRKSPSEMTNIAGILTYEPEPLPEASETPAPTVAPAVENRTCIDDPDWRRYNFDSGTSYNHDCAGSGRRRSNGQTWVCDEFGTATMDEFGRTDYEACPVSCGSCPANVEGMVRGEQVVDELSLLLTSGRMSEHNRGIIVSEYEKELLRYGDVGKAARVASQLMVVTPEFHSTAFNEVRDGGDFREVEEEKPAEVVSGYKALVYVMMFGAADSYNFIVPHSECETAEGEKDMYADYKAVRGNVAINKGDLLEVDAGGDHQVCRKFGLHPSLKHVKEMYDEGDASFVANVGVLTEKITREEFHKKSAKRPPSLFSHNSQSQALQTAKPQDPTGSGWIGRLKDSLVAQGITVGAYSIDGNSKVLETDVSSAANVISKFEGVVPFDGGGQLARLYGAIGNITNVKGSSMLGETYASSLQNMLRRTEELKVAMEEAEVTQEYGNTKLGNQFRQVSKIIRANEVKMKNERDVFYVYIGGWDTHSNLGDKLTSLLDEVDGALEAFTNEMKEIGIWKDVAVVTASDFGRTLTDNGVGTDHAWAGNHFAVGGGLKGGKVHGRFIDEYGEMGTQNVGRGRLIPTTPWEGWWSPIVRWFGVDGEEEVKKVLPNLGNFEKDGVEVIDYGEMFE